MISRFASLRASRCELRGEEEQLQKNTCSLDYETVTHQGCVSVTHQGYCSSAAARTQGEGNGEGRPTACARSR